MLTKLTPIQEYLCCQKIFFVLFICAIFCHFQNNFWSQNSVKVEGFVSNSEFAKFIDDFCANFDDSSLYILLFELKICILQICQRGSLLVITF